MNKHLLLLSLLALATGARAQTGAEQALWFGSSRQITWSERIEVNADKARGIAEGDYINITVDNLAEGEDWPQIALNTLNWLEIGSVSLWDD